MTTLEAMVNQSQEYEEWNWDRDTTIRANGLLPVFASFSFIVSLKCTMATLEVVKPISIKLQRRGIDIVKGYAMVSEVIETLCEYRSDEQSFTMVYNKCTSVAANVPRTTGLQRHRQNHPHGNTKEYYKLTIYIQLLDHTVQELQARFGPFQEKAASLMTLVPSCIQDASDITREMFSMYEDDLINAETLDLELSRWKKKWSTQKAIDNVIVPDCLQDALKLCDIDVFPNVHMLLKIGCTLPVTTAETERNNSSLKLLKTYLRTTMSTDRLSGLALMKIHRSKEIDISDVVKTFGTRKPRRIQFLDGL